MAAPWCTPLAGGVRLSVQVTPNARKTEVVGVQLLEHGAALKLKLQAQPVDGQANAALIKWLAKQLAVPRGAVELTHGASSRHKLLRIDGVSVDAVVARLAPPSLICALT